MSKKVTIKKDVLAVFDQADVTKLKDCQRLLNDAVTQYQLLFDGARVLNKTLQEKYKLPDEFEVDMATGQVFHPEKPQITQEPTKAA